MKPKREFKARVAKMQKHVKALLEIAPADTQRETLYEIQTKLDWLESTRDAWFDSEPLVTQTERRGPHAAQ